MITFWAPDVGGDPEAPSRTGAILYSLEPVHRYRCRTIRTRLVKIDTTK